MSFTKKKQGLLLCVFFSIVLLSILYTKPFFNPNSYLFSGEGDGIKTYYNYAYHIKNDTSFAQFQGMSYPFGEAMLMEDTIPLFSTPLKCIAYFIPAINDYAIGILNFFILISIAIGAAFLYLIFLYFNLPPIVSAIAANAVAFLSSQAILFMTPAGHFGISIVCFFPMGWYFLIRFFNDERKLFWSFIIALNILVWNYSHVYLGMILVMFTFGTHVFKIIFHQELLLRNYKNYIFLFIQVFIPIIIIFAMVTITNHHYDRIDMPVMLDHRASFYSVFMPKWSPFRPLYELFFDLSEQKKQSWAIIGNYIGLPTNIAIIFFPFYLIYLTVKRKFDAVKAFLLNSSAPYLYASLILLFFAMAFHFIFIPAKILNSIPLIKQFLGLGRFAWAFYYVVVVISIVFYFRILYKHLAGKIIFFILLTIYFAEVINIHLEVSAKIAQSPNLFNSQYLNEDDRALTGCMTN